MKRKRSSETIKRDLIIDPMIDRADGNALLNLQIGDSTRSLEVVLFLEAGFGLKVSDKEMIPEGFETIDNIAAFAGRKNGA